MTKYTLFCLPFLLFTATSFGQGLGSTSLPDLKIDTIQFVERPGLLPFLKGGKALLPFLPLKKRKLYLEYTITNIGSGPAQLLGEKPTKLDNITLRAYFSGDRRLNKGDFLADGMFFPNDFPNAGILAPGASYTGTMHVSLRLKTRYISVLILKIDDLSQLYESDETNNTFWYILNAR